MSNKLLQVFIPTRNRPNFLKDSLESVANQDFPNLDITILDNCSDNPKKNRKLAEYYGAKYVLNKRNLGIIGNWNKAVDMCRAKYISIFHDDDVMLPDFLKLSVTMLEKHPDTGFCFSSTIKVDTNLKEIGPWSLYSPVRSKISGKKYIDDTLSNGCCLSIAPSIVYRLNAFKKTGLFESRICYNSFDLNLILRIAMHYNVCYVNTPGVLYRIHKKQMSQTYWWSEDKAKGRLATMLELQNANTFFLQDNLIRNKAFYLKNINKFNLLAAEYARKLNPDL